MLASRAPEIVAGLNAALQGGATSAPAPTIEHRVLSDVDWNMNLRSRSYWESRRSGGSGWSGGGAQQPFGLLFGQPPLIEERSRVPGGFGFATVCVRLCDGYYWPVSFSTSSSHFGDDETVCQNSCAAPVRLFTYRQGSETAEDMVDLKGQPYSRLPTAFRYRATYDQSCKCRAHPWEQEARNRHGLYALQAEAKKGDSRAVAAARELSKKVQIDEQVQRAGAETVVRVLALTGREPDVKTDVPAGAPAGSSAAAIPVQEAPPETAADSEQPSVEPRTKAMGLGGPKRPAQNAYAVTPKSSGSQGDWRRLVHDPALAR